MILAIIIQAIAIVYLFIKLNKLESTTAKVTENKKGGYKLTFNNKTIYNANPE